MVGAEHLLGVGEEEVGVGLEVYDALVCEEAAVAAEEVGAGESLGGFLHLGVGEGEPYLADFVGGEELPDELDVGA